MRKNAKERKRVIVDDEIKVGSFFKIVVAILLILAVFSGITILATREKKTKDTEEEVKISYDKILVGSILNRSENDYFVLVEMPNESNDYTYRSLIDTYTKKEEYSRFYYVDLSDSFNQNYIGTEDNVDFTDILNIRFANTMLLHIKDGEVVSRRTGDDIMTYLEKLSA